MNNKYKIKFNFLVKQNLRSNKNNIIYFLCFYLAITFVVVILTYLMRESGRNLDVDLSFSGPFFYYYTVFKDNVHRTSDVWCTASLLKPYLFSGLVLACICVFNMFYIITSYINELKNGKIAVLLSLPIKKKNIFLSKVISMIWYNLIGLLTQLFILIFHSIISSKYYFNFKEVLYLILLWFNFALLVIFVNLILLFVYVFVENFTNATLIVCSIIFFILFISIIKIVADSMHINRLNFVKYISLDSLVLDMFGKIDYSIREDVLDKDYNVVEGYKKWVLYYKPGENIILFAFNRPKLYLYFIDIFVLMAITAGIYKITEWKFSRKNFYI